MKKSTLRTNSSSAGPACQPLPTKPTDLKRSQQGQKQDGKEGKHFAYQAVDNGAVMVLGHMGLCGGFPKVYPFSENVLEGLSAGESYQRLMNALIRNKPIPDYYPEPKTQKVQKPQRGQKSKRPEPANNLLYILWGDPALAPIAQ